MFHYQLYGTIHGHGFWLSTGTVPTVHLKILCKKICTRGTRYVPRVHIEKHFLQIYNWYVPMVQMEKKFVQIYHWYVPMVQMRKFFLKKCTSNTKWKNFLNFCPKMTKKWLKLAKSGQKNLYCWYTQKFCAKKSVPLVHFLIECVKKVYRWYIF